MIWWTSSWNPIVGCTPCSPACANCYAERLHRQRHKAFVFGKLQNMPCYSEPFWGHVRFLPERLSDPLHWRKPQRVFVCNMSDLFHKDVQDAWLDSIFATMSMSSPQHTFMLLTKRPERMAEYLGFEYRRERIYKASGESDAFCLDWPLPNVWLGTTIWDQASADRAVPLLLSTPAAKRFVSVEPMLGPVDLDRMDNDTMWQSRELLPLQGKLVTLSSSLAMPVDTFDCPKLDWVICGGETGKRARPMHPDWPRKLRDDCVAAGVPFFFKQWGEWAPPAPGSDLEYEAAMARGAKDLHVWPDAGFTELVGSRRAGRVLDGQTWEEVPAC